MSPHQAAFLDEVSKRLEDVPHDEVVTFEFKTIHVSVKLPNERWVSEVFSNSNTDPMSAQNQQAIETFCQEIREAVTKEGWKWKP